MPLIITEQLTRIPFKTGYYFQSDGIKITLLKLFDHDPNLTQLLGFVADFPILKPDRDLET